jgi:myo-inositol-1(or 4)-monophosphatase
MNPVINIAVRAARAAGNIITRHASRVDTLTVQTKGRNDFATEVDRMAEEEIIRTLKKTYAGHAFLGEEGGQRGEGDYVWIIDPLDGTANFLHGFPHYAVSMALQVRGKTEHAVIYDPIRDELFHASRGEGAFLNNRRLRVSSQGVLEGSFLGTGFPARYPQHIEPYMASFNAIISAAGGIRRAGSAALDLAYVAAARLDGYWEIGIKPWDMAGGALLVAEAGGFVSDFAGGDDYLASGHIIAAPPKLHKELLATLEPFRKR